MRLAYTTERPSKEVCEIADELLSVLLESGVSYECAEQALEETRRKLQRETAPRMVTPRADG